MPPDGSVASAWVCSVVIPAHNEAKVIGRLLDALTSASVDDKSQQDVVVVCNGCTDETSEIARGYPGVRVMELQQSSKAMALNLGDQCASYFPRFYVDADLLVSRQSLHALTVALDTPSPRAVTARMEVATEGRPLFVRAFYKIWTRLPYMREDRLAGVIGLNQAARERFAHFPEGVADDLFLHRLFHRQERRIVEEVSFKAEAPWTSHDLLQILTRVHRGNRQYTAGVRDEGVAPRGASLVGLVAGNPRLLPSCVIYVAITAAAKVRAVVQTRRGRAPRWERDESSRR